MLQPLLMICFLVVFMGDIGRPWLSPWVSTGMGAAISLANMAVIAVVTHILIWGNGRRLSRTGRGQEVRRADLTVGAAWIAASVAHAFNVLALGWLVAVRSVVGDVVVLDEALAMLPFVLVVIAAWWSLYPIDRRVREAGLIRDLDEGRAVYPQLTRARFVVMAARHQLAIVAVPVLLVMGWAELVAWGADRWFAPHLSPQEGPPGMVDLIVVLMQAAGALVVFALLPPIMRRVWDTEPLAASRIRERLDDLCVRHGVRNRDLLVWKTQGTMINGAVMGVFAPLRYIMLTDSLLDHLNERQVEAVMAHEVGHVVRKHMIWLLIALLGAKVCVIGVAMLGLWALPLPEAYREVAAVPVTLGAIGVVLVIVGFVSRRFEWQADAFAAQHLSRVEPGGSSVVTAGAVAAMTDALQAVADLNHVPPDRFSWRHGSILARQQKLAGLVGLPIGRLPIDRQARAVKIASALALAAAGILAVVAVVEAQAQSTRAEATQAGTIPQ